MSVVPAQFTGCWKRSSAGGSVPYLKIIAGGPYFVSDGKTPFSISADGMTLNWLSQVYTRHLGSGQTLLGVWTVGATEYYFRNNRSFTYQDSASEIPGVFDSLGNDAGGHVIAWEKRATIANATDNGDGSYAITAYSAFGGTSHFTMSIVMGKLVILSELGNSTEYDPVDCSSLA